jgi:hypothetical protein
LQVGQSLHGSISGPEHDDPALTPNGIDAIDTHRRTLLEGTWMSRGARLGGGGERAQRHIELQSLLNRPRAIERGCECIEIGRDETIHRVKIISPHRQCQRFRARFERVAPMLGWRANSGRCASIDTSLGCFSGFGPPSFGYLS